MTWTLAHVDRRHSPSTLPRHSTPERHPPCLPTACCRRRQAYCGRGRRRTPRRRRGYTCQTTPPRRSASHRPTTDRRARLQRAEHPRSPASAAVELWATCPRVIGQETGLRKPRSVARHWGSKHGNRRFRLLNGRVDCAAGHFHGPVTGTRAEHPGVNASVWKMSPGNRTFNSSTAASGSAGLSGTVSRAVPSRTRPWTSSCLERFPLRGHPPDPSPPRAGGASTGSCRQREAPSHAPFVQSESTHAWAQDRHRGCHRGMHSDRCTEVVWRLEGASA